MLDGNDREFFNDTLTAIRSQDAFTGAPPHPTISFEINVAREILTCVLSGDLCDRDEALEIIALFDTIILSYPALEGEIAFSRRADRIKMLITSHLDGF